MAKRLYVGNLSYSVTSEQLHDLFADIGEVASATVVTDRMTNRSKGFGFVEMATDEAAQEAITKMNGTNVDGRQISVAEARPREDRRDDRPMDRSRRF